MNKTNTNLKILRFYIYIYIHISDSNPIFLIKICLEPNIFKYILKIIFIFNILFLTILYIYIIIS